MKTKLLLAPVSALVFAMLPSCTPAGGIDSEALTAIGGIYGQYQQVEQYNDEQEAIQYQRFLNQQEAKQQAEAAAAAMYVAPPTYGYPVSVY